MSQQAVNKTWHYLRKSLIVGATAVLLFSVYLVVRPAPAKAAACAAPTADLGSTSVNISIPTTGVYRAWSRIMAPDATNNSYLLEVDGTSCYVVGDSPVPANVWTWVDYQNATTASKVDLNLTAGTHSVKMIGREANVKLDKVMFVSDLNCTPTGVGDNCASTADTVAPIVNVTAPAEGATVSGSVNIDATASDQGGSGLVKVEFYVNGALKSTDVAAPYNYVWDTVASGNGTYSVTAKAYDGAGNVTGDSNTVLVQNNDTQAPATPASVAAKATAYNKVDLTWTAATDNVGVTGYTITRNGSIIAQVPNATTYTDANVSPNTTYNYQIAAFDAAGNTSNTSSSVNVTTPNVADTQPPSTPTGLTATAGSANQVNLNWKAATDNIGVTAYDVYRATAAGTAGKIATVTTTSYGDTGLSGSTQYSYYVIARDAATNSSSPSNTASVTTPTPTPTTGKGTLHGKVTGKDGKPVQRGHAHVILRINGFKRIYDTSTVDGSYTISNLPTHKYTVKYQAHGYQRQIISVSITAGTIKTQDVSLQPR